MAAHSPSDAEQVFDRLSQIGSKAVLEKVKSMKLKLAQDVLKFDADPNMLPKIQLLMSNVDSFAIGQVNLAGSIVENVDLILQNMEDPAVVETPLETMLTAFLRQLHEFQQYVQEFESLQSQIEPRLEQPTGCNDEAEGRRSRNSVGSMVMTVGGGMLVGVAILGGVVYVSSGPVGWVAGAAAVPIGVAGFAGLGGGLYAKTAGFVEEPCTTIHGARELGKHVDGHAENVPEIREEVYFREEDMKTIAKHLKGSNTETITEKLKKLKENSKELESAFQAPVFKPGSAASIREGAAPKDGERAELMAKAVCFDV